MEVTKIVNNSSYVVPERLSVANHLLVVHCFESRKCKKRDDGFTGGGSEVLKDLSYLMTTCPRLPGLASLHLQNKKLSRMIGSKSKNERVSNYLFSI